MSRALTVVPAASGSGAGAGGTASAAARARFRSEYGAQRLAEGRAHSGAELRALPYLATGPLARQWAVRARTFDAFVRLVLRPAIHECEYARPARPVRLLDLGAGCGWLARRAALAGAHAVALDLRDDAVDGLGAALRFDDGNDGGGDRCSTRAGAGTAAFARVAASFDALPLAPGHFDLVVFNASLHYATDLSVVLAEARRVVRPAGRIVVLDSPFYATGAAGEAMVAEKHRAARARFGGRAGALLALPFVEYLTRERLTRASAGLALRWRRRRVRYPLWYEARPLLASLRGRRRPSRFDLWESTVA